MKNSDKCNLIVVRAGPTSLHPSWLLPVELRNWDIVVNYFGDDPDQFRNDGILRIDSKGTKWPEIFALFNGGMIDWEDYDFIWFPDDDLAFHGLTANRLFDICREKMLDLAQPSLSKASYFSHLITLHNSSFSLRKTNFVEVMAPCFSRQLLRYCLDTFTESISGWGLDLVWPHRALQMGGHCAVIDEIQITHTRPVGGPTYAALTNSGISPMMEFDRTLKRHGIVDTRQIVKVGITPSGESVELIGNKVDRLLEELAIGWADIFRIHKSILGRLLREQIEYRNEILARRFASTG